MSNHQTQSFFCISLRLLKIQKFYLLVLNRCLRRFLISVVISRVISVIMQKLSKIFSHFFVIKGNMTIAFGTRYFSDEFNLILCANSLSYYRLMHNDWLTADCFYIQIKSLCCQQSKNNEKQFRGNDS